MTGIMAYSLKKGSPESRAIVCMLLRRLRAAKRRVYRNAGTRADQRDPNWQMQNQYLIGQWNEAHNAVEVARRILYGHQD